MHGSSQQGLVFSLGLHLSVAAVVAVIAWTKPFQSKRHQVFELVPLGMAGPAGQSPESGDGVEFSLPDPPEAQPSPPRPQVQPPTPQPQQQRPPPPTPLRPPPPRPTPQATPPPPRQPAKPKPAAPERLSYEDFIKQHGKPKPAAPRPATATPTTQRGRPGPKIDTRFSPSITAVGGPIGVTPGRPDGDRNASEMASYLFRLAEAVKAVWVVSADLEVQIEVDIASAGRISVVRIVKSSGNSAFDESALGALRKVSSIGPPPGGERFTRTLIFRPE